MNSFDYSADTVRLSRKIYRHLVNEVGTRGGSVITYGALGKIFEVHPRALRMPLAKIQDECRTKTLPTLTTLVVDQATGIPNEGCDAGSNVDFVDYRTRVAETDWPQSPWW